MAKDGSARGGARPGAGRPPKGSRPPVPPLITGIFADNLAKNANAPPKPDFIAEALEGLTPLSPGVIGGRVRELIDNWGGLPYVSEILIGQYAASASRWLECEIKLTDEGLVAEDGKKGDIPSPYAKLSGDYLKQCHLLWTQIYGAVKDGCGGAQEEYDSFGKLLSG